MRVEELWDDQLKRLEEKYGTLGNSNLLPNINVPGAYFGVVVVGVDDKGLSTCFCYVIEGSKCELAHITETDLTTGISYKEYKPMLGIYRADPNGFIA